MFQTIIAGCLLIVAISIFATYQSASKPHHNILMGVLLPEEPQRNPEVLALIKQFKRVNTLMFILSLAAVIPLYFIPYTSFIVLYMGMWCAAYYIISGEFFCRYFSKLLLMKSKYKWFPLDFQYRILTAEQRDNKKKKLAFLHRLLPTNKDRLLAGADQPIYVDEDEYWINGYYCNPDDKRTMVEKRVGYGSTSNLATKQGKIGAYAAVLLSTIVIGGMVILFMAMDFATFRMSIEGSTVKINAPIYDYQFEAEAIEEVTLTDTLPKGGIRTNGAATGTYYLGNFRFDAYGSSKVFLYTDYPPYIVISLTDKTVLFNTKSEEETEKFYQQLIDLKERYVEK